MTIPTDNNIINQYIGAATFANGPGGTGGVRTGGGPGGSSSWYEAMSRAWGQTLDAQATEITTLSDAIGAGDDQPSQMVALTAASLKMQFMSNNAATSQNSVAEALSAVARKQ
ncbi:MAG TPA: hypothetical protein PK743_06580 [Luteimonas sp.]|nr:hypothetical protein [Luteimonas sp.]HRO26010.1 hypothetical protein [Luteimonas sp.]HRP72280.1 hypothetical protein [Luteimonas sp.]